MSELQQFIAAGQVSFSNLLFTHYRELDLTPSEFIGYLFLSQHVQTHVEQPDLKKLAHQAQLSQSEFFAVVSSLTQKGAIQILTENDQNGRMHDVYDVSPLLDRLAASLTSSLAPASYQHAADNVHRLFTMTETEFGRPLTPIEQQSIREWINTDHYAAELVELALREAVLNQVFSLKYMDRILINWEKRKLTTVTAVQQAQRRFDSL